MKTVIIIIAILIAIIIILALVLHFSVKKIKVYKGIELEDEGISELKSKNEQLNKDIFKKQKLIQETPLNKSIKNVNLDKLSKMEKESQGQQSQGMTISRKPKISQQSGQQEVPEEPVPEEQPIQETYIDKQYNEYKQSKGYIDQIQSAVARNNELPQGNQDAMDKDKLMQSYINQANQTKEQIKKKQELQHAGVIPNNQGYDNFLDNIN